MPFSFLFCKLHSSDGVVDDIFTYFFMSLFLYAYLIYPLLNYSFLLDFISGKNKYVCVYGPSFHGISSKWKDNCNPDEGMPSPTSFFRTVIPFPVLISRWVRNYYLEYNQSKKIFCYFQYRQTQQISL